MSSTAIFYRGMYKDQLKRMCKAQDRDKSIRLFMQPYSRSPIVELRDHPPTSIDSVTLYLSTNEDFTKVSWQAEIIDWRDKQKLSEEERQNIDREVRHYDSDLFGIEEGMVNLLQLRNLVKLEPGFSVIELTKINGGEPVSKDAFRSGWVYVEERKRESGELEGDQG